MILSAFIHLFQCHYVDLVHYMGGNVRRDFKSNVTHLVANMLGGEKYEVSLKVDFCALMLTKFGVNVKFL